ncbi:hypothetical protein [Natronocalculus amylovorans]|nr:hypothetical protein [Natronocalculus amylovorans]
MSVRFNLDLDLNQFRAARYEHVSAAVHRSLTAVKREIRTE